MNVASLRLGLKIFGGVLIFVAAICLAASAVLYFHIRGFVATAVRTHGTITRLEKRESGSEKNYFPVFTFDDATGRNHEVISPNGSFPPAYEAGEKVTVLYQPDNPHEARLDSLFGVWGLAVITGGMGIFNVLVGLGMYFIAALISRKESPPSTVLTPNPGR